MYRNIGVGLALEGLLTLVVETLLQVKRDQFQLQVCFHEKKTHPCVFLIYFPAPSAPRSVSYEVVNAAAIRVSWSITGSVNGFVIYTISSGLDTVTKQLTDSTLREYIVDGLLPERDYSIAVRGYYELLGPANTITVRLEGTIVNSVDK